MLGFFGEGKEVFNVPLEINVRGLIMYTREQRSRIQI